MRMQCCPSWSTRPIVAAGWRAAEELVALAGEIMLRHGFRTGYIP